MTKKLAIILLLALLVCIFALLPVATFATDEQPTTTTETQSDSEKVYNTVEMIIYYCLLGVAFLGGIPLYIAMKKRDKREPHVILISKVNHIRTLFESYCKKWETDNMPVRKLVRLTLAIKRAIDIARNAYYDKRENEYNEIELKFTKITEMILASVKEHEIDKEQFHAKIIGCFQTIEQSLDVLTIRKSQIRRVKVG